ncbi:unnamed protein product, partial [Oikopleura dioica]
ESNTQLETCPRRRLDYWSCADCEAGLPETTRRFTVQLRYCSNLFPEYNYDFLRRFRSADDLYVKHSAYMYRRNFQSKLTTSYVSGLRSKSPYRSYLDFMRFLTSYLTDSGRTIIFAICLDFPPSVTSTADADAPFDDFLHLFADTLGLFLQFEHKYFCADAYLSRCSPTCFDSNVNILQRSIVNLTESFHRLVLDDSCPLSLCI